ncbi:unnamed protein product (macronuclear) [Paramecium tetraurelia]|uniref:Uncharacterized protein n=1 Tax=Paramecium tetraurelia TaxID=5888 RepID=A0D6U4_PARTE|nr:uncharacterized protein GSPATT00001802001 [Paramecium tetraurelia]CAK78761.1 unnamed protein product [Paramecium tetraurelia]|eukprot:XP_001446158.1 hypothetical protein (macronuclear) [Paramecium tetraurelia strain d4-2]
MQQGRKMQEGKGKLQRCMIWQKGIQGQKFQRFEMQQNRQAEDAQKQNCNFQKKRDYHRNRNLYGCLLCKRRKILRNQEGDCCKICLEENQRQKFEIVNHIQTFKNWEIRTIQEELRQTENVFLYQLLKSKISLKMKLMKLWQILESRFDQNAQANQEKIRQMLIDLIQKLKANQILNIVY